MLTDLRRLFRPVRILAVLAPLALAACSSPSIKNPTPLSALPQSTATSEYLIQPGDDLDIRFFYNPELNDQQIVRPDGRIGLQLVGEQVVAGKSPRQVEQELRGKYERDLRQPEIAVILRAYGGQKAYVDGEVTKPGMIDLAGGRTILQAVAEAGGVKPTGTLTDVIVIRRTPEGKVAVPINMKAALEGSDVGQDISLKPYDVVFVPRSGVADVNLFIEQYFRNNVPIPFGFGYTF